MKLPRWLRPRFNLKTLLLLITLFCVGAGWFAWQQRIVRERWRWHEIITNRLGRLSFYASMQGHQSPLPWYRTALGDRPVLWIKLHPTCGDEDREQIESLFPEAVVGTSDLPPRTFKY